MTLKTSIVVELSDREAAFVTNLAHGVLPTAAAIQAGYAGPTARALLHKPHIEGLIRHAYANLGRTIVRIERENAEAAAEAA